MGEHYDEEILDIISWSMEKEMSMNEEDEVCIALVHMHLDTIEEV